MEHRINKLELKVAAQDQVIATLQDYLEGLEDVQYSNRTEYTKGFEHYEQKRKKSSRLFVELNASVAALQDQQAGLASKEELQALVDRTAASMHAPRSPPPSDLMVFSPPRPLIHIDESVVSPAHLLTGREAPEIRSLQYQISGMSSPLLGMGNYDTVPSLWKNPKDILSVRSLERDSSSVVRLPPPTPVETAQTSRRVMFDISDSDDPLALNTTPKQQLPRKTDASSKQNPRPAGRRSPVEMRRGPTRRKTLPESMFSNREPDAFLYQYKDHRRNSDYNDQASSQAQAQAPGSASRDAEATLHLAERAILSVDEAKIDKAADSTRRTGKQANTIAAANKENKRPVGRPKGSARRRKTLPPPKSKGQELAGIRGSNDEEEQTLTHTRTRTQMRPGHGQDTEDTIVVAKRAVPSFVEVAADGAASGPRRSGRAPKPRNFDDFEGDGGKMKRSRES